jgi:hypothetical protein
MATSAATQPATKLLSDLILAYKVYFDTLKELRESGTSGPLVPSSEEWNRRDGILRKYENARRVLGLN